MICTLLALSALAQDVPDAPALDLQRWSAPLDGRGTLWTWDAADAPRGWTSAGTAVSWQRAPVVYRYDDGSSVDVVERVWQTSILGAWSAGRVLVGAELPLLFGVRGEDIETPAALGDASLAVKGVLLDHRAPVGLAVLGRVRVPSTAGEGTEWAPGSAAYELGLVADLDLGPAMLAMNLGTHGQPREDFGDFTLDDALAARLGASWRPVAPLSLGVDLVAEVPWESGFSDVRALPVEGLANASLRLGERWSASVGGGRGLTSGVGSPELRLVAMLRYDPRRTWDRDADGLLDAADACPDVPEDRDGHRDEDGCEDLFTPVRLVIQDARGEPISTAKLRLEPGGQSAEGVLEMELAPGTYQTHVVAPGFKDLDRALIVPNGPLVDVAFKMDAVLTGSLEVIALGPGQTRVSAASWRIDGRTMAPMREGVGEAELPVGKAELEVSAPGYVTARFPVFVEAGQNPPLTVTLRAAKVEVTRERLVITDKIYFDTDRATITPESYPLLDEIAGVLLERTDILSVAIEGHTDSRGTVQANQLLSEQRAASVRDYLIRAGVAADRLSAFGYGESKPLDDRELSAAWDRNRRVEFLIEGWAP